MAASPDRDIGQFKARLRRPFIYCLKACRSVDKVEPGASRAGYCFELILGRILIIVDRVLDVQTGRRHLKMNWTISQCALAYHGEIDPTQGLNPQ